jgi:hypothetical protein
LIHVVLRRERAISQVAEDPQALHTRRESE